MSTIKLGLPNIFFKEVLVCRYAKGKGPAGGYMKNRLWAWFLVNTAAGESAYRIMLEHKRVSVIESLVLSGYTEDGANEICPPLNQNR